MGKLNWSLRICFQDGTLTQLLAGGLHSLSWDHTSTELEFLHDMAASLPQKEQSKEDQVEKHNVFLWPNLENDTWWLLPILFFRRKSLNMAHTWGEGNLDSHRKEKDIKELWTSFQTSTLKYAKITLKSGILKRNLENLKSLSAGNLKLGVVVKRSLKCCHLNMMSRWML